jgi:hypothetical protein
MTAQPVVPAAKPLNSLFPPPLRSGGNAAIEQRTPGSPPAPLRGEPGVRDRCHSGTAQLPHSPLAPLVGNAALSGECRVPALRE